MSVRADIAGIVNNDLVFTYRLTYNNLPLDLTSATVTAVVKPSQTSADNTGTSYAVGSGLTMIAAKAGRVQLRIARAANAAAGNQWYRVDVTIGGNVYTCMCGVLNIASA